MLHSCRPACGDQGEKWRTRTRSRALASDKWSMYEDAGSAQDGTGFLLHLTVLTKAMQPFVDLRLDLGEGAGNPRRLSTVGHTVDALDMTPSAAAFR